MRIRHWSLAFAIAIAALIHPQRAVADSCVPVQFRSIEWQDTPAPELTLMTWDEAQGNGGGTSLRIRHAIAGGLIGAVAGFAVGMAIMLTTDASDVVFVPVYTTPIGAVAGAVVGAAWHTHH